MDDDTPKDDEAPYNLRLSFRSYRRFMPKLELIAKARNFLRDGKPNISAVLNYIIERFDVSEEAKIVKKMDAAGAPKKEDA